MAMKTEIPSLPAILSAAASTAATVVLIRNIAGDILPRELRRYLRSRLVSLFSPARSSQTVITVHDFQDFQRNQLYADTEIYLSAKISASTNRFRASVPLKETQVILSIDSDQEIIDVFGEAMFIWKKVSYEKEIMSRNGNEEWRTTTVQYFELRFDMKHRDLALNSYFSHIQSESSKLRKAQQSLKIHMLSNTSSTFGNKWTPANLDHPATFSTLAMDPEMKRMIIEDLDMFVNRKDFYRRVGKAWKRGYLLFGPPGTGKSSLIAAIANYLKFDIYDLELSVLSHNTNLRTLLTTTANRSILVVEDIDCSLDLDDRRTQTRPLGEPPKPGRTLQTTAAHIPLSGLLNFMDGLWSSCGDERIIIFTTNHKERLDPALLRPGRMDLHIHMSYCTPCGFRMLASNYIGLIEHPLLTEIEQLMTRAKVTPAEVGEQLMRTPDPETALKGLLEFIKSKIEENGPDEGDSAETESKDKTEEAG